MTRKKASYKLTIGKHGVFPGKTEEDIRKEVQRTADYQFYASSDSCEVRITSVEDLDEERKKAVYIVVVGGHGVFPGETEEDIRKEVQRDADYRYYASSDSCVAEITSVEDFD
ncbi:MAG: hypothetical protein IJV46_06820 [Acidaminococcaceae bacterium]|nr:hypothetical protein [Acidaminococcaceae bacterium]